MWFVQLLGVRPVEVSRERHVLPRKPRRVSPTGGADGVTHEVEVCAVHFCTVRTLLVVAHKRRDSVLRRGGRAPVELCRIGGRQM